MVSRSHEPGGLFVHRSIDLFGPVAARFQTSFSRVQLYSLVGVCAMIGALLRVEVSVSAEYDM